MRLLTILFPAMLLVGMIIAPVACAETPYITIDPIGDHAIGEIFFINGTTNLPLTENLTMVINSAYRMAMKNSPPFPYQEIQINNISVNSKNTLNRGTNWWSVNITDNVKELQSDNYQVSVVSSRENIAALTQSSITAGSSFHLFPANNVIALATAQTTNQNLSPIQLTTSQTLVPPTTQSSPLPSEMPIVVLAAIAILRQIFSKKRQ